MKKTAVFILALVVAITVFFTGCGKKDNMINDNTTTSRPATTQSATTTKKADESRNENAGEPESTKQRSAIGDIVEGAADGVGDVADGIGDAAEDIGDAANRAANDVNRNVKNKRTH